MNLTTKSRPPMLIRTLRRIILLASLTSLIGPAVRAADSTISVTAFPLWTDSGLTLTPPDTVTIHDATGLWTWGLNDWTGADGTDLLTVPGAYPAWVGDEWVPDGFHGQLIGFVGPNPYTAQQGAPALFPIGTSPVTLTGRSGRLWLGFNDDRVSANTFDNFGAVTVNITLGPDRTCGCTAVGTYVPPVGDCPVPFTSCGDTVTYSPGGAYILKNTAANFTYLDGSRPRHIEIDRVVDGKQLLLEDVVDNGLARATFGFSPNGQAFVYFTSDRALIVGRLFLVNLQTGHSDSTTFFWPQVPQEPSSPIPSFSPCGDVLAMTRENLFLNQSEVELWSTKNPGAQLAGARFSNAALNNNPVTLMVDPAFHMASVGGMITKLSPNLAQFPCPGVTDIHTAIPGQNVVAAALPGSPSQPGLTATLDNSSGTQAVTITVAPYPLNPVAATTFDLGSSYVDLKVTGATANNSVAASFYYPSIVTGTLENKLILLFFTGSGWAPVLSSGGASPIKNTTDNLDNTVSGGRFSVVFDMTSTPQLTQLNGTFIGMAIDTTPPVISCPGPIVVSADRGKCSTQVNYSVKATDNSGIAVVECNPPSGSTFPGGTTTVYCTAADPSGNIASCSFTVTVQDQEPPVIVQAYAAPNLLWPPNHKMVPVSVNVDATDNCGVAGSKITAIASSEPPSGRSPDWEITGDLTLNLRADRLGGGNGRVYSIILQTTDTSGNVAQKTVKVTVPHDNSE